MEVNQIPKEFENQEPKGKFFVSKKAVMLYFAVIIILILYMVGTAMRLPNGSQTCGTYSYNQVAHAERTYAWAFVHPTGNIKQYVQTICKDLNSTSLILPS